MIPEEWIRNQEVLPSQVTILTGLATFTLVLCHTNSFTQVTTKSGMIRFRLLKNIYHAVGGWGWGWGGVGGGVGSGDYLR